MDNQARILAKAAIDAERRAEYAVKIAARKREELSAYLSAYKRKAETRRRVKREGELLRAIPVTVKHTAVPQPIPTYQLGVKFDMKDSKTGEIKRDIEGWSTVHEDKDYYECNKECVRHAQSKAGGTNWNVIRVVSRRWIRYE